MLMVLLHRKMRHSVRSGLPALFVGSPVRLTGGGRALERARRKISPRRAVRGMGGAKRYPSMRAQKAQEMMGFASLYPSYDRHTFAFSRH